MLLWDKIGHCFMALCAHDVVGSGMKVVVVGWSPSIELVWQIGKGPRQGAARACSCYVRMSTILRSTGLSLFEP